MNIFIEKKTNIGFYNLKDPLGFNLYLSSLNYFSSFLFILLFKLSLKINLYDKDFFFKN